MFFCLPHKFNFHLKGGSQMQRIASPIFAPTFLVRDPLPLAPQEVPTRVAWSLPGERSRVSMRGRWIKCCCLTLVVLIALPSTECLIRTIHPRQQDIGSTGSGPVSFNTINCQRPQQYSSWHHHQLGQRARPLSQAAHEPTAVDMDVPDLAHRKCMIKIKPAKFHNLRFVSWCLAFMFTKDV